ncbi:MAG: sigma-54 dependent transcriptional regulator [Pirellulaceae bacterium]|nr:sigma-54 dependent transcriptional regulator [Pirellulaceae bacterium]
MKILFADDEASLQSLMSVELPRMGHVVTVCPDGVTAAAALERNTYDCVLVDLDMPGMNGIDVIARAKELSPDTEAVVLTGKKSLETALAAVHYGVFEYLSKPCKLVELESLLRRIAAKRDLTNKYRALKRQLERIAGSSKLVGDSSIIQLVRDRAAKVAPTNSTVLIRGETGTGKELVARAVHEQSLRVDKPFVAVNCGALPESLIESELFGHRKGAFTGADEHRVGLFEVADGGTLFLDEIGELPKALQAKLLRVLESGEIRRVGDNENYRVDVRIVCATHRDLNDMVAADEFRQDLMFRINTFEIYLPPLRERTEDISSLARHLLLRFQPGYRPDDQLFSDDSLRVLQNHDWPGNVRELANVIEHATILCSQPPIELAHLPDRFGAGDGLVSVSSRIQQPSSSSSGGLGSRTLREIEMQAVNEALERHQGNKTKAAEQLGVSLKTLYNKLNQLIALEKSA